MEEGSSSSAPSSSSSLPPDSNPILTANTSKFLTNLPSRGLFSSTFSSSNPGGMRVYVCDHDTAPPEYLTGPVMEGALRRAMTNAQKGVQQDGPQEMNFQCLTVERLRGLLREKGLSIRGRRMN